MKIQNFLDLEKLKKDSNGIWVTDLNLSQSSKKSQKTWERIYNFNLKKLKEDRKDFNQNKLEDHVYYLNKEFDFTKDTIYLEIGCGPSYIGEYMLKNYGSHFVGIDFNYQVLLSLKKYLEGQKLKNFTLVHGDINAMPIKDNSIDFIYGGGVIEHFPDTTRILSELYRVLKRGGMSFNTVPAFNIMWLVRFWNNIPTIPFIKNFFEIVHINFLNNKVLNKYHGYELSYTFSALKKYHQESKFKKVHGGAFAFHPSSNKLENPFLRELYYRISKTRLLAPIYYIVGTK